MGAVISQKITADRPYDEPYKQSRAGSSTIDESAGAAVPFGPYIRLHKHTTTSNPHYRHGSNEDMLQLTFTGRPLNSTVVNSATHQMMYDIRTPHLLGGSTMTVRDVRGEVVAKYESSVSQHDLTIGGERRELNEWLEREHTLSLSRRMHAPNGRTYEWKRQKLTWLVTDCETGQLIAMSQSANKLDGTKFTVEILEEGLPILDAMVTTFAILEARAKAAQAVALARASGGAGQRAQSWAPAES